MGLRRRIEIPLYRVLKPLSQEPSERRQLPGEAAAPGALPEPRSRGPMAILRGKAAAVVMTAALAGGVGVMVGGFVEDQRSDETLDFVESSKEEQLGSLQEHRAETDVCMAEAEARAKPEDGMFGVITDPQLDKCYAEQELKVAEINAEASR